MKNKPISNKEEIQQNPDNKIDQDFQGYPAGPARDETIQPQTEQQRKVADIENKDGEKRIYQKNDTDEQDSMDRPMHSGINKLASYYLLL